MRSPVFNISGTSASLSEALLGRFFPAYSIYYIRQSQAQTNTTPLYKRRVSIQRKWHMCYVFYAKAGNCSGGYGLFLCAGGAETRPLAERQALRGCAVQEMAGRKVSNSNQSLAEWHVVSYFRGLLVVSVDKDSWW